MLPITVVSWQDVSFFWSILWWLCNNNIFFFLGVPKAENVWRLFHGKISRWKWRSLLSMTTTGLINLFILLLLLEELDQFIVMFNREEYKKLPIVCWLKELGIMGLSYQVKISFVWFWEKLLVLVFIIEQTGKILVILWYEFHNITGIILSRKVA